MYFIFEVFMFVTARLINLSYVVLLMPGLGYMLIEGAYTDAFIVHENSVYDSKFPLSDAGDDNSFLHSKVPESPKF